MLIDKKSIRRRCVYMLVESIPYEGDINHGCFSSFKKAEARKNWMLSTKSNTYPLFIHRVVVE